ELLKLAKYIQGMTIGTNTLFIVNHRIDIMLAADADGIHLGWQSLPAETVRKLAGPDKIIGISLHSPEEVRKTNNNIDYIILSPIFCTPSKEKLLLPLGISTLKEAVSITSIPIIALGGINESNLKPVFDSGASGAGFIRAVFQAKNIEEQIYKLKKIIQKYKD
ncbi:thiamine phosphate synthase, partial [Candidatus Desantisbacteria bacterium]|nr:thiamine phosphate synthase [Candidatus Desantisbacteria bacterium]